MKVRKEQHDFGSTYYLEQDDKCLKLIYGGNLDLYWYFFNKKARQENVSPYQDVYESMLITKENYTIYSLFESLIRETKSGQVFLPEEVTLEPTFYDEFDICDIYDVDQYSIDDEDRESLTQTYRVSQANKANESFKKSVEYQELTKDNAITWHSDDAPLNTADIVRITEVEEGILLEFTRPDLDPETSELHFPGTLSIRFSNSGSRYGDLVTLFIRMYNRLNEYEPDYHQIHLEEIAYQKKLTSPKKDN